MNYLAHAHLSFGDEEVLVGNLISDFVKGKAKFNYPDGIQRGIQLHRSIDSFTDNHDATRLAKQIFRPAYRLYSGAFVDVAYDHFLAIDPIEFTEASLAAFAQSTYLILDRHIAWLPEQFLRMLPYMKEQNWLLNYRTTWGTEASFGGLVRRAQYLTDSKTASELFERHYSELGQYYRSFFPDVKSYALNLLKAG